MSTMRILISAGNDFQNAISGAKRSSEGGMKTLPIKLITATGVF